MDKLKNPNHDVQGRIVVISLNYPHCWFQRLWQFYGWGRVANGVVVLGKGQCNYRGLKFPVDLLTRPRRMHTVMIVSFSR